MTSLGPEHEPIRHAVRALRYGILPEEAMVDVWRAEHLLTIDVSLRIDVWGDEEWLASTGRASLTNVMRWMDAHPQAAVRLLQTALRDAADALFACRKHDDCRGCVDIGKACLAQRRSGVRCVNVRCAP